jgi:hypothetical protein
MSRIEQ